MVGAPKCGTSAIHEYLTQHPEVFVPERKEPQFFGSDLSSPYFIRNEDEYLALFDGAGEEKAVGEVSVWSLYSRTAAREIKEFNSDAQIVVMLREPASMLYSLHSQYLRTGNEDIESFKAALSAEEDRKRGLKIPKGATFAEGLFYRDVVRYSEQVERYLDAFGRDRVHVVLYDDLRDDPWGTYEQLLRFLGVSPNHRLSLRVVNSNSRMASSTLRNSLEHPPAPIRLITRALTSQSTRLKIVGALDALNSRFASYIHANPLLMGRLRAEFAPEVKKLGQVLNRDLNHWLHP